MAAELRIGLAGWSNPPDARGAREARTSHLSYYASEFSCVEINSSFKRDHRPATYARWRESTPASFRFSVKMPRTITHEAQLRSCRVEAAAFMADVGALAPKLTAILVQLPPSLAFERRTAGAFFDSLPRLPNVHIVCEPRHASWFTAAASACLQALGVSRAGADPPRCTGAGSPVLCRDFAYFRWHGSPKIYYSSYSDATLTAFAERVRSVAAKEIWCIFDNTARYAAWPDARRFRAACTMLSNRAREQARAGITGPGPR